jgi:uncharacterized membrane protein
MKSFAIAYVGAFIAFLALDSVWLTVMGPALYKPVMGDMLLDGFRPVPALLFYVIYLAAVVYFGVRPDVPQTLRTTAINGVLLGFAAYATYDLTNQATLKNWSTTLTVADLAWGSFVTAVGACAGRLAVDRFG